MSLMRKMNLCPAMSDIFQVKFLISLLTDILINFPL